MHLNMILDHGLKFVQGYRGPGGLHDWSPERNNSGCIGGITGYIDKVIIPDVSEELQDILKSF